MEAPSGRVSMPIVCGLWTEDIHNLGDFEFASVPRAGDRVSLPNEPEQAHTHYKVERVVHRAAGPHQSSATFLFVSKVQD
jgi:hypothetical protein